MSEDEALAACTGWVKVGSLTGYYPPEAALVLIDTGKYALARRCLGGCVLEELSEEGQRIAKEIRRRIGSIAPSRSVIETPTG